MNLLHTWAGVILGSVLFAMFWMGTLSVFDREIDRWMLPATRLSATGNVSLDTSVKPAFEKVAPNAETWNIVLPTERVPAYRISYKDPATDKFVTRYVNPNTGELLPDEGSYAGTGFIFPFHFNLHLKWYDIGYWLVGLAGMTMLVLLVSGVIIHRRIFVDFFTFRPQKTLPRSSLDLHNITGVYLLPFHFTMALSGLIIFFGIYFPVSITAPFGGERAAFNKEVYGQYKRDAANKAGGEMVSLNALAARAVAEWGKGKPYFIRVWHPGDANAYVEVRRSYAQDVTMNLDQVYFDAYTGETLYRHEAAPVVTVQRFISGLHFVQFDNWTLRFMYFFAGLGGCVLIATGFLYWLESRRKKHIREKLRGVRVVEALTVGSTTGIIIATLGFFIANRLIPVGIATRGEWEMLVFYLVWLLTFVHAFLRPTRQTNRRGAFIEQAWTIAAFAVAAVGLNWATTGDNFINAVATNKWEIYGTDAMLLGWAIVAAWSAVKMQRTATSKTAEAFQTSVIQEASGV